MGIELARPRWLFVRHLFDQPRPMGFREGRPPCQQLVKRNAETVHVAARIGVALEALRGHVAHRTENVAGPGQLVAAFGLGDRLAREKWVKEKIDSPELANELVGPEMRRLRKESLRVILLDTRYHLIRVEEISLGSINESIAHPRDVFRPAVISSAYAVIVVHNHPSGDASPSQTDHSLTRRLAEAAELLQIKLLDHIIIGAPSEGNPGYFSFKEAGVL